MINFKSPPNASRDIGWFELIEHVVGARNPSRSYSVSLVGPSTLGRFAASEWSGSVEYGHCIINGEYEPYQSARQASPLAAKSLVSWPDAKSLQEIARAFVEARHIMGEALSGQSAAGNVLIDATAFNKSLLASIVAMLIRTRAVKGIDLVYQQVEYLYQGERLEAVYAGSVLGETINELDFAFSALPYIEGKYKAGMRRHIVLLCGLDFQRVMEKVRELEPAAIDVIIEKEALVDQQSAAAFYKLCHRLEIPRDRVAEAPRFSVRDVLGLLESAVQRGASSGLHSIFLTSGGKPFTIAATLSSVLVSECPMLSTVPDRVVHLDRNAVGPYRLYRLTDRTSVG